MTSKKWLIAFVVTAFLFAVLIAGFNYVTDPFGVFGDTVFTWYSYDMTNNPRTAKISYLDRHHEEYDSYIVGCSSTSSFPVEAFDRYLDAKFYNTIVYGADMLDSEQMITYLIDHYGAKNIVLNVYIDNAVNYGDEPNAYTHCMPCKLDGSSPVEYYTRFLFANPAYGIKKLNAMRTRGYLPTAASVFNETTGAYDKRARDVEPISDRESYLTAYPIFEHYPHGDYTMPNVDNTLASIGRIKDKCDACGVNFIVVTAPVYCEYLTNFAENDVVSFYSALAEITDYWDFSYSSVSFEPRYFYDGTHFRNDVGTMAAARIFGDDSIYIPDDFGYHVTAENADEYFTTYYDAAKRTPDAYTKEVPVLMYHHIAEETNGNGMIITPEAFEAHMKALSDNGYTAVMPEDLENYVKHGTPLPEKPVLITFDDGYESNYTYAFPAMMRYGMKGTVFVIGSSVGKSTYKSTDVAIIPHFGAEEITEMTASGVIGIQSHTYDMHESTDIEGDGAREKMARLDGESESDYVRAVTEDSVKNEEYLSSLTGKRIFALAYPQGYYTDTTAAAVKEAGVTVTFSTREGKATVIKGLAQSLLGMKRFNVSELSAEELISRIEN